MSAPHSGQRRGRFTDAGQELGPTGAGGSARKSVCGPLAGGRCFKARGFGGLGGVVASEDDDRRPEPGGGGENAVVAVAVHAGRRDQAGEGVEELEGQEARWVRPSGVGWAGWRADASRASRGRAARPAGGRPAAAAPRRGAPRPSPAAFGRRTDAHRRALHTRSRRARTGPSGGPRRRRPPAPAPCRPACPTTFPAPSACPCADPAPSMRSRERSARRARCRSRPPRHGHPRAARSPASGPGAPPRPVGDREVRLQERDVDLPARTPREFDRSLRGDAGVIDQFHCSC